MSKALRHVVSTYGRSPGVWFAFVAEAIRAFVGRVVTVLLLAGMVASVSAGDFDRAQTLVIYWLILTLSANLLAALGELIGYWYENIVYGRLSLMFYDKITNKDMAFYRDSHSGAMAAMHRQYADSGLLLTRLIRGDILRTLVSLVFPAVVMLIASWQIGLAAIALVVSQIVYVWWSSSKANQYRQQAHELYRKVSGVIADDVTNVVAFKSAGKEREAHENMKRLRSEEMDAFWNRRKTTILLDFPRNIIVTVLVAFAFWIALGQSSSVDQTVGLLVLTITYMFQILRNASDLPSIIQQYDDLVTKLESTLDVLDDTYEDIKDGTAVREFNPDKGAIEIRGLSFAYNDQNSQTGVFQNLNLSIKPGEKVGIVGVSGAGKSTLANLLMRFDDIQQGSILIDGVDIRDVKQSELRSKIAYVPQEPLLFHRTIRENIAYHNNKATDNEVEKAARAAHAEEFIKDLPEGYNTVVGERGVKLSGGQKQRVVIARAILKKAPIIVFDEATSALDSESEAIIQRALPDILGDHTAVIIAHRLSTVSQLDRIVVMSKGKIVEEGTHKQLLAKKGRYYALWQRQTSEQPNY
jgi:ATP-binding cassette subfamily B protein